jgi:hypothetical protein
VVAMNGMTADPADRSARVLSPMRSSMKLRHRPSLA